MERKKFLKQNSQNKWQKRGLEDNYFKLPFSQNILPKMLRIFAKNVESAQTHFWLPGHLVPLVELVMGEKTREDIALCVRDELTHWKKVPVLVKRDVPGQLANRIFQAIIRESIDIVASGLAGAEDVDAAISYGMAMRFPEWGPLKHLDAIGLDLGISVQDTVLPDICAERHSNTYLKNLVDEGKLGVKSKQGFYDWKVRDIEKEIRKRDQFIIETVKLVTRLDKE